MDNKKFEYNIDSYITDKKLDISKESLLKGIVVRVKEAVKYLGDIEVSLICNNREIMIYLEQYHDMLKTPDRLSDNIYIEIYDYHTKVFLLDISIIDNYDIFV